MSNTEKSLEEEIDFLDFCISQTKEDIELSKKGEYRFTHPAILKIAYREYHRWLPEWIHSAAVRMLNEYEKRSNCSAEYLGRVLELEQEAIKIMKVESKVRQRYIFNEPGFEEAVMGECKKHSYYMQVKDPEKFESAKEDRKKLEYLLSKAEPGKEPELRKFLEKVYEEYQDQQYESVKNIIADKKTGLILTIGSIFGYSTSTVYRKKGEEYIQMGKPLVLELKIAQLFKVEPEALATPEARKNIKLDKPIDRREIGCIHYDTADKNHCETGGYNDCGYHFEDPDKLVQEYYPEESCRKYGGTNPHILIMADFDKGRLDVKNKT